MSASFWSTSALLFTAGKAREPLPAPEEAEAAMVLRTQPCLALKPQSIPRPRTGALLGGGERTSDGPQHRCLKYPSPACFCHPRRVFSRLLAAGPVAVSGSAHLTPETQQRQSHPQSHPGCRDSHQLGKKLDLYKDTHKPWVLTGRSEHAACPSPSF